MQYAFLVQINLKVQVNIKKDALLCVEGGSATPMNFMRLQAKKIARQAMLLYLCVGMYDLITFAVREVWWKFGAGVC